MTAARIDNLPIRLSSFVGREREIVEVAGLLSDHRLVTLVGAPGVGKTRLALRVADETRDRFSDGVAFVELAGLAEPELVPRVIATALDVEEHESRPILETLISALVGRPVLLVLDNCEHLVSACAAVAEMLLGACPELHVLATSREALRCDGEINWHVPSLSTPPVQVPKSDQSLPQVTQVDGILAFEAVRLFVDRATAIQTSFALTNQNAEAIATICRRLDGIPLALELAAARVALLSPAQIAARLDDRFHLLTGGTRTVLPRQQTLEATIDWSYELLPEAEQGLLRRLSVFAGTLGLAAAERVCAASGDTPESGHFLDLFARLVDKSLVQVDEEVAGEPRYRLLEMVRQYAFERMLDAGEASQARTRHRDWFLAHVERTEPLSYWAPSVHWLDRLEADHDNLRAALDWCLVSPSFSPAPSPDGPVAQPPAEYGLRLILALFWPWFNRNHMSELRWWYDALLAASEGSRTWLRARALLAAGLLATHQRDLKVALQLCEQGSLLASETGDRWANAWATELDSHFARVRGEPSIAAPLMESALRQFQDVDDSWGVSWALRDLGSVAIYIGDFARAHSLLTRSLEVSRAIGDEYCASLALDYLGMAAYWQNQFDLAGQYLEEGLEIGRRLHYGQAISRLEMSLTRVSLAVGEIRRAAALLENSLTQHRRLSQPGGIAGCLDRFAEIAEAVDEHSLAAQFIGATNAIRAEHGAPRQPVDETSHVAFRVRVQSTLGADVFERNLRIGSTLTVERAVEAARNLSRRVANVDVTLPARTHSRDLSPVHVRHLLTRREYQVADLVARGLTNRRIAEMLTVSRRTVDAHVASILARLGFSTRAQIAVWVATHGLDCEPIAGKID